MRHSSELTGICRLLALSKSFIALLYNSDRYYYIRDGERKVLPIAMGQPQEEHGWGDEAVERGSNVNMDQLDDTPNQESDLLRTVFQGKWRLRVLQEIAKGPVRLSQLRRTMPECSKKVLIDTLRGLEQHGWIERKEYPTKLKRVEYSLISKYEQDVRRAIAIASNEVSDSSSASTS